PGPGATGTFSGTIGGKPFTMQSGLAHSDGAGSIDLVLSSQAGVCQSASAGKLHAGEMLVGLYGLTGTAPGTYTSANNDIKFASMQSTCASGTPVESAVDKSGRVTTSTITLQAVTSSDVQGTLDLKFDDGSAASGTFDVPTCASTLSEGYVCY